MLFRHDIPSLIVSHLHWFIRFTLHVPLIDVIQSTFLFNLDPPFQFRPLTTRLWFGFNPAALLVTALLVHILWQYSIWVSFNLGVIFQHYWLFSIYKVGFSQYKIFRIIYCLFWTVLICVRLNVTIIFYEKSSASATFYCCCCCCCSVAPFQEFHHHHKTINSYDDVVVYSWGWWVHIGLVSQLWPVSLEWPLRSLAL